MNGFISSWIAVTVEEFLSAHPPVHLSHEELSWVMALPSLGAVLSPIPVSFLMDQVGRRNSLLALYTLPVAGWLLVYYATNIWLLGFARLVLGCWSGIAVTVTPVYIGEISDPKRRSFLGSFTMMMMLLGGMIGFVIGISVEYDTFAILGTVLSVVFCIILFFVPESPYYYMLKGKMNEAMDSMKWLFKESDVQERFNKINKFIEAELKTEMKITDIFSNTGYFKSVLTVIVITVLIRGGGASLFTFIPILLPKQAFFFLSHNDAYILYHLVNVVCSFRQTWLIKFGIRTLLITSCTICGIMMSVVAVWESVKDTNEYVKINLYWIPFVSFLIFSVSKASGAAPIVIALKGEMFPTELKCILSAVTTISGNLAAFIVLKLFFVIRDTIGNQYNFVIAYTCSFSIALFTYYYVLETEGKSLEQIQCELQHSTKTNCDIDCNKNNP